MSKSSQFVASNDENAMDLITACSVGRYGIADFILKNELEDVNKVNSSGWSAVMYAANYGHYSILRLLIRHNCDVDHRDWQGRTALMLAASNGHTRSIEALVRYGRADKTLKDLSGANAYQYAKNCGHGSNVLIKSLLLDSHQSHEPKRISMPKSRSEPSTPVNFSRNRPPTEAESSGSHDKDIFIPKTEFPNSIWKPIKSQVFNDIRNNGSTDSLVSETVFSSSPPESADNSDYGLSSSQSSHSSVISLPPNVKRKLIAERNQQKVMEIVGPMEKSLFHLLSRIDLIQYLDLFESNAVDFYQFLTLTDDDMQRLGITNFGHRKKLSIAQMRYHESLDIKCTHESFLADYLLNERLSLNQKIKDLENQLKNLGQTKDNY